MDPHMTDRRIGSQLVHLSAASCDRAGSRLQCEGSSEGGTGGTVSHSSDTAAPLLGPEGTSSSSGSPATAFDAVAAIGPDESTRGEAACSQASAAPEGSVLDGGKVAAGQEGSSSGSDDNTGEVGGGDASQAFPVAGFSRKDTPYICQVPGCERDLAREKPYYRRYRVCRPHAAAKEVGTPGDKRRYCQQCSIFHTVAEFDDEKRTCRARLQWHNSKRRKRTGATGAATGTTRPTTALQRKATRRSSSTLEATVQAGLAAGAASTTAEVKAEAPAAEQPARAAVTMAQRSMQRRSLGKGAAGHPAARSPAGLLPFSFAPKGRRSTAAQALAVAAARAPDTAALPLGLLPAAMPSLPAAALPAAVAPAPPPTAVNWHQGSELPLLPPLPDGLQLLPQDLLGTLLSAPEPPPSSAGVQSLPHGSGTATPSAVGPLPPPGHAWSVAQPLAMPQQQPPATARQHMDTPPPMQQQATCQQLPEQQPPSARSCSAAADWHAELLQMPLDWDGRLPEDAPGAAGLPTPPLQGGAASPPSPQGGRAAGAAAHEPAVLQLVEAPDPLDEALLPPPPPLDVDRQLAAAAAHFPAVAAAAAAAWGLQWPPPPPVQQMGGAPAWVLSPQEPPGQQQCSPPQPALHDASPCIERLGSNPAPLHEWGAVPTCIVPALPDLAWSLAVSLQGGHAMDVEHPQPSPTGATCMEHKVLNNNTGAGKVSLPANTYQLHTARPTLQQQEPAQEEPAQQSASDSSTHCGHPVVQMQTGIAAAAAGDVWDELLAEDVELCKDTHMC